MGFDAGFPRGDGETETSSKKEEPHAISRGAAKCGIRNLDASVDRWLHLLINSRMMGIRERDFAQGPPDFRANGPTV